MPPDSKNSELVRVRRDTNKDGFEDLVAEYGSDGRLKRVALDENRDGKPEIQGLYDQGKLGRVVKETQADTDDNGRIDRWERYEDGRLLEIRSDNDGDGRADQWERFDHSGRLISIGYDTDRDGKPDRTLELQSTGR